MCSFHSAFIGTISLFFLTVLGGRQEVLFEVKLLDDTSVCFPQYLT